MKWLITGGLGFIGTNLSILINEEYSEDILISADNGQSSLDWPEARYSYGYEVDVCSYSKMKRIFENEDIDVVIHLASNTEPRESVKNPYKTLKDNLLGILNILELSKIFKVNRVMVASSCGVAGDEAIIDGESYACPNNPYTYSKSIVEDISSCYGKLEMSVNIMRFSNVYGPYSMKKTSAVHKFIKDIILKKEITIFGDGNQTRDFIHVEDVCRAILMLVKKGFYTRNNRHCISSGVSVSVNDVVEILKSCSKNGFKIKMVPENKMEVKRINTDNRSLRSHISWQPKISIVDGLSTTYDWFVNNINRRK
jgi:UDP-glucose 4-epimerase